MKFLASLLLAASIFLFSCGPKWSEKEQNGIMIVTQEDGPTLGYSPESGVTILTAGRQAFKDLNKNGSLDPYEDWRLSVDERAADLASKMSIEQIAGLMLYSGHQRIPGGGFGRGGTYNGKYFDEGGALPSDLTDQQIEFLTNDNLRHVLITTVESAEVAAQWNNNAQALVEGLGLGIPANNSSDPRHEASSDEEYTLGAGGDISRWPGSIGLAASFDPQLVRDFGTIASDEYRALGISTALSPQVDLATDPRWYRFGGTFGPSPKLTTDMGKAYIEGFQTSFGGDEISNGWGFKSVNAMTKHWPGGGSGEGGRDAHYGFGKFAVFPGNNQQMHMTPFVEGAFKLDGGTGMTAAIMPYYTISFDQNPEGENVGNAFSKYFITDLLRDKYQYDGVVCTDWGVTRDDEGMAVFGRTPWGVEDLTVAERHYKIILAGCDQFGGNNDAEPVLEAYEMGKKEFGEEAIRARFEKSAVRLLRNIFRVGLFENPYVDIEETRATVGKPEYMAAGFEAQKKSVVMLKNKDNIMPLDASKKVYMPKRMVPASSNFFGEVIPASIELPVKQNILENYVGFTEDPAEADVAIIVIHGPQNGRTGGYSEEDRNKGGNGFLPISLQYGEYTAVDARESSIAGDSRETDVLNRSYRNKTVTAQNYSDLIMIRETVAAMNGKPVIVILKTSNPVVISEVEAEVDGLLVNFFVSDQAVFEIISGKQEPSGLLPMQMPANMSTVETQYEDVPFDLEVHVDTEGHAYDFAYGMNWNGVINDERVEKYRPGSKNSD
ncbi:glycoside hydrolase family 3 protein [Fulvivirga sedimenti]|uniref:beta-glucosidase n=1 Tax=Fulvivirga sedimenti TaxID=2879465 RepID=A0A9X1HYM0_9BACT|nr:glycoside hydrolase family 3 N-terminal domain-containing protein [Fulvivirga sedimenti]MCA6079107.1 glycoside hydrolase family 3 C-terminal domain-containing protein [Fulvivirga sedimenti]